MKDIIVLFNALDVDMAKLIQSEKKSSVVIFVHPFPDDVDHNALILESQGFQVYIIGKWEELYKLPQRIRKMLEQGIFSKR
ncbi:hypothetical protein [Sphingobacterium sp. LRF_L2]|uniref:hypothetical protein n=1 Tax=Sphingobacterium sp. LRF_L2 TaxID=3369421 RepID=UPI003F5E009D